MLIWLIIAAVIIAHPLIFMWLRKNDQSRS